MQLMFFDAQLLPHGLILASSVVKLFLQEITFFFEIQLLLMFFFCFFVQSNHDNLEYYKVAKQSYQKMISSGRYRPAFQITIADIFQDYNDPRKQMLCQRVQIALEEQERRLKCELDANNLANLQILLKKQQIQKQLEQKLQKKAEEAQHVQDRLQYTQAKIKELKKQIDKCGESTKITQNRLRESKAQIDMLLGTIKEKEKMEENWQKQKINLIEENDKLQQQNSKYRQMIGSLKANYSRKLEESEYLLKVRQNKMKDQFNQNLEHIITQNELEKSRKEIENRTSPPKKQTFSRQIQCNILEKKQTPRKPAPPLKLHTCTQTEQMQEKMISEFLEQSKKESEKKSNLQQVRLIYSRQIQVQTPLLQPRIIKYFNLLLEDKQIQTINTDLQTRNQAKNHLQNKEIQANLYVEDRALKEALKKQKEITEILKKNSQQKEKEIERVKKDMNEAKVNVEQLRLKVLELQLELEKKELAMAMERETLTLANKNLEMSQNDLMIRKFSGKTQMLPCHKPKYSKTCSLFFSHHQNTISHPQKNINANKTQNIQQSAPQSMQDTFQILSPRKFQDRDTDIITIIRKAHNVKFFKAKRHSMTEEDYSRVESTPRNPFIKRSQKKYSKAKKV